MLRYLGANRILTANSFRSQLFLSMRREAIPFNVTRWLPRMVSAFVEKMGRAIDANVNRAGALSTCTSSGDDRLDQPRLKSSLHALQ